MELKDIQPTHALRKSRRVGRGGKRGTYSGRGIKGQKSRAGARIRPQIRDLIKRIPKLRGKVPLRTQRMVRAAVNVGELEKHFKDGERVTPKVLSARGLIGRTGNRLPEVKLLAGGSLTRKLLVAECQVSGSAKEKIEKAGGSVE